MIPLYLWEVKNIVNSYHFINIKSIEGNIIYFFYKEANCKSKKLCWRICYREAVAEVVLCAKVLVDVPNFLPLLMSA